MTGDLLARLEFLLAPRIKNEIHSRVRREKGALIVQALKKILEPGGLSSLLGGDDGCCCGGGGEDDGFGVHLHGRSTSRGSDIFVPTLIT